MELLQTIKKSPLFLTIDEETLEDIVKHCRNKKLYKGQELFAAGDDADNFYIILNGWVKLSRISRDGEEIIIHVFGPGESFAEAAVFGDKRKYPVYAQSIEDAEVVEIPRSLFIKKIEEDSRFALRLLGSISAHQHYLVQQLEQVTSRTAPQRIGAFLLRFCKRHTEGTDGVMVVDLPYDKAIISTRLSIKPETFSRALAKLEPYGVSADKRSITIKSPEELANFCDVD
ncbi:MAG: Crp/Fnr family transcriptional regulator [Alphaproteobacteria bacterium]